MGLIFHLQPAERLGCFFSLKLRRRVCLALPLFLASLSIGGLAQITTLPATYLASSDTNAPSSRIVAASRAAQTRSFLRGRTLSGSLTAAQAMDGARRQHALMLQQQFLQAFAVGWIGV